MIVVCSSVLRSQSRESCVVRRRCMFSKAVLDECAGAGCFDGDGVRFH